MKIDMEKVSYILGQSIGTDFRRQEFDIGVDIFINSFKDALAGKPSNMPSGEMRQIMTAFQSAVQEKQQAGNAEAMLANLEKGKAFMEENSKKEGIITTDSGMQYRIIREGDGKQPGINDTVETHYEGKTLDGNIFDSSIKRGTPVSFPLNGVIKGWQEGLQLMKEGAKYELFIPSELAYGQAGGGGAIGPHETLIFEVELLKIK